MVDERWVHARLDSPLFASLVQVVELSVPTLAADIGAARVFDAPTVISPTYVSTGRLDIHQHQEPTVHDWPMDPHSAFEQLRAHAPRASTFRLSELLTPEAETDELFGPIETHKPIVDALGTAFSVEDHAWCLLILFRCGDNAPFKLKDIQRTERLRQHLAASLRRAYHQETQRPLPASDNESAKSSDVATAQRNSTASLLAKLSRTERRVLSFLRSRYTERQIAERMDRSPHTVHVHVKNIYRKFAVCSRRELMGLFERQ